MAQEEKHGGFKKSKVRASDELELLVQCADIVKSDSFSSSDPFVRVYQKRTNWFDSNGKKLDGFVLMGETEHFIDNPNPIFETKFKVEYFFEETQILRFECYDWDKDGKHDLLGSCDMNLGEILNNPGSIKSEYLRNKKGKPLKNKKTKMYQRITCELNFVNAKDRDITLQFQPLELTKMDILMGSADAYFKLYRIDDATKKKVLLFNRRVTEDDTNDKDGWILFNWKRTKKAWPQVTLSYQSLCDCDKNKKCINIEVWDADKGSNDDLIGEATVTFDDLQNKRDMTLYKEKHGNKSRGTIKVLKCQVLPTMVDFIQGGTDLSLVAAIDLTGSNGDPQEKDSLHCISNGPSDYQRAIRSIGTIVEKYDSDKKFPVYGFGVAVKDKAAKWQTYHAMELNRWINHGDSSEVQGVYGIEKLYLNTIETIMKSENLSLSGPTNVSPILNETFKRAKQAHNDFIKSEKEGKLTYYILLLLTDGAISANDEANTKSLIVEAANEGYPLSVIIVGIGNAEFGFLEELDADDPSAAFKDAMGVTALRDIVQFVKFNSYSKVGGFEKLAKDTLQEIPRQFMSYINKHRIAAPAKTQALNTGDAFKLDEIEQKDTLYEELDDGDDNASIEAQSKDPFLDAPLPPGWDRAYTGKGAVYYVNHKTKHTQWLHPDDPKCGKHVAA